MAKPQYATRTHGAARRGWEPIVRAGGVVCPHCGGEIVDGKVALRLRAGGVRIVSNWALDHIPGTDQYRGPAHMSCNARDGARRGNASRRARRRPRVPGGVFGPLSS